MATNRSITATSAAIVRLLAAQSQRDPQLPRCAVSLLRAEPLPVPSGDAVVGVHLYRVGSSVAQLDLTTPLNANPVLPTDVLDMPSDTAPVFDDVVPDGWAGHSHSRRTAVTTKHEWQSHRGVRHTHGY
jgi:hypothetical protein